MLFAMLIKTARLQSHYCFYLMVPIAILFNVLIGYGMNVHVSKKPEKNRILSKYCQLNTQMQGVKDVYVLTYIYTYIYVLDQ